LSRNENAEVRAATLSPGTLARALMIVSAMPSPRYALPWSGLRSTNGSTATDAASGTVGWENDRHATNAASTTTAATASAVVRAKRIRGRATLAAAGGAIAPGRIASENWATGLNRSAGVLARARCSAAATGAGTAGRRSEIARGSTT